MNKSMSPNEIDDLSKQQKWVLRLLYAPQSNHRKTSIKGKTRLMKGLFLVDRKLKEKPDGPTTGFNFEPYKYGPFDQGVYTALDALEHQGLVKTIPKGQYQADEIDLTTDGENAAEVAFEQLSSELQTELSWIKGKHVQKPLSQLLSFVYNQYPDMAENSKLNIP